MSTVKKYAFIRISTALFAVYKLIENEFSYCAHIFTVTISVLNYLQCSLMIFLQKNLYDTLTVDLSVQMLFCHTLSNVSYSNWL